jgi:hypothetical membrane protein
MITNLFAVIWRFARLGALPAVYFLMLLVMFILPFFSVEEYSMLRNTTSHLGAQGAPHAWVMNAVFSLLGAAAVADSWPRLSNFWLHKVLILAFGASLFLAAFFQHAPIVEGVAYNAAEDSLHSALATITGFSFTFFAISSAFIESTPLRRIAAAGVGIMAMLLSLLIFNVPDLAGVWQRIIFIVSFAWLIFFLYPRARD